MGWFYIVDQESNEIYEMAVTKEVKVSGRTKISSEKTEDKTVVSDNAVAFNPNISYNGVISSITSIGVNPRSLSTPDEYIESLEKVRTSRKLVTCHIDNKLNPIEDCVIEDFTFQKSEREGVSSWKINLVCQQIRVTTGATSTRIPSPATKDATESKVDAGNATTKQVEKPITTTILAGGTL